MKKFKLLLVLLLIFVLPLGCGRAEPEEEPKREQGENEVLLPDQVVDGIRISGFLIQFEDDISDIVAVITNMTGETVNLRRVDFRLFDEDDNELIDLYGFIGNHLDPEESIIFTSRASINLLATVRVEYYNVVFD